tara:strand:+ start:237 stop:443 length:207 start_codon:yes stop_codon:yes gene_type:complete
MKHFFIEGKGYYNAIVDDPFIRGVQISDIKSGYGYIEFKGTDNELDKFLEHLYQDETYFKVIGIHEAL